MTELPTGTGHDGPAATPTFPNYLQMRRRVPIRAWHAVRVVSVLTFLGLCGALFVRPEGALFAFWRIIVPSLPLLFFLAPGVWRNICPLAAANQTPRLFGFSRARTAPAWLKERGYLVAIALFFAIVPTRKVLFEENGPALAMLLLVVIVAAFSGGFLLKGKSGWCSSVCPLLPVQRLYGQTPFVTSPNGHCQPCVGCTKNCYDFNPLVAYQADMYDNDPQWSASRKLFAGAFPGLVVAFFTLPSPPDIPAGEMYLRFAAYMLVSAGSFFALTSVLRTSVSKIAALYGATALNLFYWYTGPRLAAAIGEITGADVDWVAWPLRAAVLGLSLVWLVRTVGVERKFVEQSLDFQPVRLAPSKAQALAQAAPGSGPEVLVVPEQRRTVTEVGTSLLEVLERAGLPIEAGCRMGMCGSDPIAILEGMDNVSALGDDEANTLRRLGLASNSRLACSARVRGDVCLSLTPEPGAQQAEPDQPFDPSVRAVVIVGNGIAGVTAADFVRRSHPDCDIHLVGREAHFLYNRMGISRLIYGRSAMQGLYLLPENWYDDHHITPWLNTQARAINLESREVSLGTGETLAFDRLILATGSSSSVPGIGGYGLPGSFVLREAGDAIAIRAYVQDRAATHAVVAGAGLLGLEAAYALRQLGLEVTVLERGSRLLRKQIDDRASYLLAAYLKGLGIDVLTEAQVAQVQGDARVSTAVLKSEAGLACDVFLVCAGIRPNVELARDAGIEVNHGVVVDDLMRTSAPGVYAAGDVAEHEGQVPGLWPVAVTQAEVAAINAAGGNRRHVRVLPPAVLKGVGIDLMSMGRFEPTADDEVILLEDPKEHSYGKLVISQGTLAGAILLGRPLDAPHVMALVKSGADLTDRLPGLRQGDWRLLDETVPATAAALTSSA